jgi:hypothetical protein
MRLLLFLLLSSFSSAQELTINGDQARYAGTNFNISISGTPETIFSYRLTYLNRTLKTGSSKIGQDGSCTLNLAFPSLKKGVIAETLLTCSDQKKTVKKTLYFFAKEIDSNRKIGLWSPDNDLYKQLKKAGLNVHKVNDIARNSADWLIIHSMDFSKHPGISKAIVKLCHKGVRIILTDPLGSFETPEKLISLNFYDHNYHQLYDKKLNTDSGNKRIVPDFSGSKLTLKFLENKKGFFFCKLKIGKGEINIVPNFKNPASSPVPLYLLKSITQIHIYYLNHKGEIR